QCARACLVHLRDAARLSEGDEETARARQMFVCFCEATEAKEEEAEIILDPRAVTRVAGLLEVKTCGGELDERAVNVILPPVGDAEHVQSARQRTVKFSLQ